MPAETKIEKLAVARFWKCPNIGRLIRLGDLSVSEDHRARGQRSSELVLTNFSILTKPSMLKKLKKTLKTILVANLFQSFVYILN